MPTYLIRDWNEHFETAESRKLKKLSWVALPNKHDGKSFRRLMRMDDGMATYGVWVLIVQVASKCPKRGLLVDADGPLSAEDIADKTGVPEQLVSRALEVLSSERIKWIEALAAEQPEAATSDYFQCRASVVPGENPARPLIHNPTGPDITLPSRPDEKPGGRSAGTWTKPGRKALENTAALMAWAESEAGKAGISDLSDDSRTWILAAAERSVDIGDNPPRLFAHLIQELAAGDTTKLVEYRSKATKRFQAWRSPA